MPSNYVNGMACASRKSQLKFRGPAEHLGDGRRKSKQPASRLPPADWLCRMEFEGLAQDCQSSQKTGGLRQRLRVFSFGI
jgi:hypothetical protein